MCLNIEQCKDLSSYFFLSFNTEKGRLRARMSKEIRVFEDVAVFPVMSKGNDVRNSIKENSTLSTLHNNSEG